MISNIFTLQVTEDWSAQTETTDWSAEAPAPAAAPANTWVNLEIFSCSTF